ncbi:MAG TPA: rhodanese-like domain-containing protein, partial [Thermoanaerobaculia bacterium]|nr:rhodanese-like domain-containing protein [Thermoanaerobaculia bacterium]
MDPQFDGMIFQTHAAELDRRRRYPFPPFLVLDVRSPEEFGHGHIPGAVAGTGDLASVFPGGRLEVVVAGGE